MAEEHKVFLNLEEKVFLNLSVERMGAEPRMMVSGTVDTGAPLGGTMLISSSGEPSTGQATAAATAPRRTLGPPLPEPEAAGEENERVRSRWAGGMTVPIGRRLPTVLRPHLESPLGAGVGSRPPALGLRHRFGLLFETCGWQRSIFGACRPRRSLTWS